ncbi:MAG: Ada metal-binding domain-containing protein [Patescibacteria group bacterium]
MLKTKIYRVLKKNQIIESLTPGKYAGWKPGKIFGRLDCKSGMRMKKENRVFFLTWQDAITAGYRPCKNCRPTPRTYGGF